VTSPSASAGSTRRKRPKSCEQISTPRGDAASRANGASAGWRRQRGEDGHLANNPALYDLLEEQVRLEQRIAILEGQLAAAAIVVPAADGAASIGSVVRLRDRETGDLAEYEPVGPIESDIANGRVSIDAPVGRALVSQGAGAVVDVETPGGRLGLKILSVRTREARLPARKAA
jgi:transcription elongation factor GreA